MLPRILKGFTVYVDGRGYVGRVENCQLPNLEIATDEYRGGGMDAPVDHDMGMNKLTVSMTIADYDPEIFKQFGLLEANTPIVVRGAIQRQGEGVVPVVVRMRGGFTQINRGQFQQGQRANLEITGSCNTYSESINGETVVDIDVIGMKRIIGGVDQLAGMRAALGA